MHVVVLKKAYYVPRNSICIDKVMAEKAVTSSSYETTILF